MGSLNGFTFTALTSLCIFGLFDTAQAKNALDAVQRPNVLFLVVDDLRPALGCYGKSILRTQNIDNLARKSILFEQAFVQQAVCGPSRVSFLTSRRPDTTRLYDFYSYWRVHAGNYTTLPQHFKENGYITQSVGKVFHPGIACNKSDDSPYSWTNTPYHPSTQAYKNAKVCPNKDGTLGVNIVCPVDVSKMPEQSLPDLQSSEFAVQFLKNMSATQPDQPFFLAVGFHKPHIPLKYPKEYLDLYPLSEIKLAKYNTYPWWMPLVAWNPWTDLRDRDDVKQLNISFPFGPVPDHYQLLMRQSYYAATSYMDAQVGKILAALEDSGFSDNTIVSFVGDHGWSLGEHQEWSKYSVFEVSVRVPLIMYIPGVTHTKQENEKIFPFFDPFTQSQLQRSTPTMDNLNASLKFRPHFQQENITTGRLPSIQYDISAYNTSALVELVDLFPTLAEAAGLPTLPLCPDNPFQTWLCTEGTSLMPLIKNITRPKEETLFVKTDTGKSVLRRRRGAEILMEIKSETTFIHLLAKNCSDNFTSAISNADFHWKKAVFSQYPRPSVQPRQDSDLPRLKDIRIMGYSMVTPDFHYVEWVGFKPNNYTIEWDDVYGRELYLRATDPYEIENVSLFTRCFPLVNALSKQLRIGWRGALPD